MAGAGAKIGFCLSVVLFSHCVFTAFANELRFFIPLPNQPKKEDVEVEVKVGSSVTFICVTSPTDSVFWYKGKVSWTGVYNVNNDCKMYPQRHRFEAKSCTKGEYRIVVRDITSLDQVKWFCQSGKRRSQKILMNVKRIEPTIRFQTTWSQTAWSQTTRSKKTLTTTALQRSFPSNGPILVISTTTTYDQSEVPNVQLNLIAVIGGAVGGVIGLVLFITIVAVVRRTRTHSRDEKRPTNDDRAEGRPRGQHNDFGAFEDDIGGQYAAISDTKNPTPDKVVAENPMYESYGQEDGGDHVPDVYSVVQKPLKSQSSTNDGSKDPNPPVTEDNVADVYSVVQKPSKLQESGSVPDGTKDTQPSGSDEMGDVYSVVQKPAKG